MIDKAQSTNVVILSRLPVGGYEKLATLLQVPDSYFGVTYVNSSPEITARFGAVAGIISISAAKSQSENASQSINDILSTNLANLLRESDASLPIVDNKRAGEYGVVPSARIIFWSSNRYALSCQINVEYDSEKVERWKAFYIVEKEEEFDSNDQSQRSLVRETLKGCLDEAKALFLEHITNRLGPITVQKLRRKDGQVQSLPVYDDKLPDRVVHNSGGGIWQFRRSNFQKAIIAE